MKELIQQIRRSKGMNKSEFARAIGVTPQMVGFLESGERKAGRRTIRGLVRVANHEQKLAILNELGDDKMGHSDNGKDTSND